jgi:hypothetical protein
MPILEFSLLDNALDSLMQGVEYALDHKENPSKLKVAILLVAQAVELVLKERLKREHWSLIFRKVEQAGNDDAHTVTIDEAVKRLEQIAGVRLNGRDSDTIDNLRKTRNRIQHYKIELSFEQALGQISAAIGFLIRFLHAELGIDIKDISDGQSYQRLLEVEETLQGLREVAQARVKAVRGEHEPIRSSDRAAWFFEVIECPACWEEFYVFSPDSRLSECQLCGYEGGFVECDRCGQVFPSGSWYLNYLGDELVFCDYCWSYLMEE